ncbi:protein of unknown function DUF1771 [Dillenia turbinata]|uniref:Smr domain-containing protein n=1 Tax=Dillenia turbinata TaxID=194707 RepID=A0AAN8VBU6_9MAGN
MNLSDKKGIPTSEEIPNAHNINRKTTLNPNAAEFIPFALRSPPGTGISNTVNAAIPAPGPEFITLRKAILDRSESSVSTNSDDEAHQYWRHQLPDDITPDFKVMGGDDSKGLGSLSFAGLSLKDTAESTRFSSSTASGLVLNEHQELSPHRVNGTTYTEKIRYSPLTYGDNQSSAAFPHLPAKPWDKQIVSGEPLSNNIRERPPHKGNSRISFLNDVLSDQGLVNETDINPVEFLASQFPGFSADSLAEVFIANGCDLNLTREMLTQLELQVDGDFNQNMNSKTLSAPNLSALDFPALPVPDHHNMQSKFAGESLSQNVNHYQSPEKDNMLLFKSSSSFPSRGAIDFASAVKNLASQDSTAWKYDRNGSTDANAGPSRSSSVLAGSYNGGRGIYGDRTQSRGSARVAPMWLETGEAVANLYSDLREEARNHACLRNAYFEQARQAYLIGNKALAKELSVKGQLHSVHMKAAHEKAQESIYRQRNPLGPELPGNGRGQERMIDLHGLHVSEAIHVLKHELTGLRSAARSADQRLQVYICVGTGHHTRGSRTPARLPVAVQRYLLEEEGLDYSEPQPGLLQVVVY